MIIGVKCIKFKVMQEDNDEPATLHEILKAAKFVGSLVIIFLCLFILLMMFFGCNPSKVAARKDVAAVERVKGSRALINQIAPIVNDLFPCNRDSVIITKSDTVIHYDTTQSFFHYEDSVFKTDTLRLKIVITRTIHDTTKIVTDSKQRAAIDGQTIANLNIALSASSQSVIDADKETKSAKQWLWWFIGALVCGIVSNIAWVYFKFKP